MPLSDELTKLHELHQRGAMSEKEFARAKERVLGNAADPDHPLSAINAVRRSRSDRWLAGVCGGLALATGLESWAWRLIFSLLALCGGAGLVIYALLWIFVPRD